MTKPKRLRISTKVLVLITIILAALTLGKALDKAPNKGGETEVRPTTVNDLKSVHHDNAQVKIPDNWQRTEKSDEATTWSSPDKRNSVTLASIEAGGASLRQVVQEIKNEAGEHYGEAQVSAIDEINLENSSGRDSAYIVNMKITENNEKLYVKQVWRRDSLAGYDAVATWVSSDETWPLEPQEMSPHIKVR